MKNLNEQVSANKEFTGMKKYNVMFNVGKIKYVINHHDGKQKHKDGSEFFGISTFRNKREFNKACKSLEMQGYVYGN